MRILNRIKVGAGGNSDAENLEDLQGDRTQLTHGLAALVSRVRQKDGNESTSLLFASP